MRNYFILGYLAIVGILLLFGIVVPGLLSAKSDFAVVLGITVILGIPPIIFYLTKDGL